MADFSRKFVRRGGKESEAGVVSEGVTLTIPDGPVMIDGNVLPPISVERLMLQALSPLLDSYAGTNKIDEARDAFGGVYDDLLAGRYNVRSGAGGVDPVIAEMRRLVGVSIRAADRKNKTDRWAELKAMEDADRIAALDAIIEKQPDKKRKALEAKAAANVEERQAKAAAEREAAEAIEL